ncbi:MAG: glutamine--fructose-6-phosphate transaminase (isomerizing) [Spirochaetaceae bacterium]|nr:glutamine--fructose-6-phosphate transaminase (isomerizing) [Spirochaetaceae bacterium]
MCGIVGYTGPRRALEPLLTGLGRLEYRGYDSAGVALVSPHELHVSRAVGPVRELRSQVASAAHDRVPATCGIAHTRWATHGAPSERNAHPHLDTSGRIALVHNGIIENHASIRQYLTGQGIAFASDTDTEALVQLIGFLYEDGTGSGPEGLLTALCGALREVQGTFGIAVSCVEYPGLLIAARRGSPLLIGIGEGEHLISSDGAAIVEHTSRVVYLHDNEVVTVDGHTLNASTIDAVPLRKKIERLELSLEQIERGGYPHFMLKEIHEQPEALRNTLRGRIDPSGSGVNLGGLGSVDCSPSHLRRIVIAGCGTAWHAGLVGKYLIEEIARVPTDVEYSSELRYRNAIVEAGTIALFISQSGETADTIAAMSEMRAKGATVLGVINVVGSTLARETQAGMYLHAGPEIGVASTKAFTSQLAALTLFSVLLGRQRHLSAERCTEILEGLRACPRAIEAVLRSDDAIRELVARHIDRQNWLYLGRGVNFPVALEGALKLKELSYIHAEGMPAAEMKHGPLALIDRGMPVVFVAPRDNTTDKVIANIEEVRVRGGHVIAIATEGDSALAAVADDVVFVPRVLSPLSPLVTTVPLQLIAYHAALQRGHDVDRPRNLAKSVTVE